MALQGRRAPSILRPPHRIYNLTSCHAPLWPCRWLRRTRSAVIEMARMAAQPAGPAEGSATPHPLEVLVYCGEGAGYHSARNTLRALQRCVAPGVQARLLHTPELLAGSWRGRCLLLVMPGGADLPYCKHLNGRGNRLLRSYVELGGSYLGICAGAYYASRRVEFERGGPLEVVGDRELGFFPGTARGAAYPGFDYLSERGACAAPLRFRPPPPSPPRRPPSPSADAPPSPAAACSNGATSGCGSQSELAVAAAGFATAGAASSFAEGGVDNFGIDEDGTRGASTDGRWPTDGLDPCCERPEPPPLQPPRLGRHHLLLDAGGRAGAAAAAGALSGNPQDPDPARDASRDSARRKKMRIGGAGMNDGAAVCCRSGAASSVNASSSESGQYDGWVHCRDYSNGGPVFIPPPPPPPRLAGPGPGLDDAAAATEAAAAATRSEEGGGGELAGGGAGCGGTNSMSYTVRANVVEGDVEVLAVYPELDDAVAALRCHIGEGVAVLCGTHPEMPHEALTAAVHLYDGQQARHVAALGAELAAWEPQRRQLWAALLIACCTAAAAAAEPTWSAAGTQEGLQLGKRCADVGTAEEEDVAMAKAVVAVVEVASTAGRA